MCTKRILFACKRRNDVKQPSLHSLEDVSSKLRDLCPRGYAWPGISDRWEKACHHACRILDPILATFLSRPDIFFSNAVTKDIQFFSCLTPPPPPFFIIIIDTLQIFKEQYDFTFQNQTRNLFCTCFCWKYSGQRSLVVGVNWGSLLEFEVLWTKFGCHSLYILSYPKLPKLLVDWYEIRILRPCHLNQNIIFLVSVTENHLPDIWIDPVSDHLFCWAPKWILPVHSLQS